MSPGVAAKVIAACSGLAGFVVAIAAGLEADNPADVILTRALIALVACQALGWMIGVAGEHAVRAEVGAAQRDDDSSAKTSSVRTEVVPKS